VPWLGYPVYKAKCYALDMATPEQSFVDGAVYGDGKSATRYHWEVAVRIGADCAGRGRARAGVLRLIAWLQQLCSGTIDFAAKPHRRPSMRSRIFAVTLLFVPLLIRQQQPPKTFADCDKTAHTQADLTECASTEYKTAEDELNSTYQQLLRKTAGDRVAVQQINSAQKAWVAFRDAQIAALYPAEDQQKEYGTVFPMGTNLALANLTRNRTRILRQMLNPVEGDVCGGGMSYPEAKMDAQEQNIPPNADAVSRSNASRDTPKEGYVPDSTTAIEIAEAVMGAIYGKKKTGSLRPYIATLSEDVWDS
jgi:uncharacterized protein YecT (DUF1311 family)